MIETRNKRGRDNFDTSVRKHRPQTRPICYSFIYITVLHHMWFLDGLLYVRKIFSDEQRWVQFRQKPLKIQTAVQLFLFQKASPVSLTLAIMVELVHKIRTHSNALALLGGEGLHVIKVSQVCAVMYVHVQVHTVCMNTLCRYILYILQMCTCSICLHTVHMYIHV